MKIFLSIVFASFALSVSAQLKAATVTYDINVESGMEDNAFGMEMMKDAEMIATFDSKNNSVKTTMGPFMTSQTIVQRKKKKAVTLMDAMGTKYGVSFSLAELKKQNTATATLVETGETKVILGYTCKKATFVAEGGLSTGEVWYTTEIKANMDGQQFFSITTKGFILEELSVTNGVSLRITAKNINPEPVNAETFSLTIPEGYKVMTAEEFGAMQGTN